MSVFYKLLDSVKNRKGWEIKDNSEGPMSAYELKKVGKGNAVLIRIWPNDNLIRVYIYRSIIVTMFPMTEGERRELYKECMTFLQEGLSEGRGNAESYLNDILESWND